MKDKLIIAGLIIAIVFSFLGYLYSKQLAQRVSELETEVAALSSKVEDLNKNIMISEKAIPFIEGLIEALNKIKAEEGSKK